jgi:hypothetical protein
MTLRQLPSCFAYVKLAGCMSSHNPLTGGQLRRVKQDIAEMRKHAEQVLQLMTAGYGESDQRTVRAGELTAAIQRLEWAIERSEQSGERAKRLADKRA